MFLANLEIVMIDSSLQAVLKKKTEKIKKNEFFLAKDISEKLFRALDLFKNDRLFQTNRIRQAVYLKNSLFFYQK
jgi:hypothetical protein